jgi:hypothetical protein
MFPEGNLWKRQYLTVGGLAWINQIHRILNKMAKKSPSLIDIVSEVMNKVAAFVKYNTKHPECQNNSIYY